MFTILVLILYVRLQSTFVIIRQPLVHVFSLTDTGKVAYPAAEDVMTNVFVCVLLKE